MTHSIYKPKKDLNYSGFKGKLTKFEVLARRKLKSRLLKSRKKIGNYFKRFY